MNRSTSVFSSEFSAFVRRVVADKHPQKVIQVTSMLHGMHDIAQLMDVPRGARTKLIVAYAMLNDFLREGSPGFQEHMRIIGSACESESRIQNAIRVMAAAIPELLELPEVMAASVDLPPLHQKPTQRTRPSIHASMSATQTPAPLG